MVSENKKKVLGIVGGMGPLATQLLFKYIIENTEAACDQDHLDIIIYNHSSMPDRTQSILSGNKQIIYELIQKDILALQKSGVCAVAVPCNTSHVLLDDMQKEVSIPIIHMIKETVKYTVQNFKYVKKVGILATTGTIKSQIYSKEFEKANIKVEIPSESLQEKVMYIIYEEIKKGRKGSMDIFNTITQYLKDMGCDKVILACTELSCFKENHHLSDYFLDPLDVLAYKCIEICDGKRVIRNE